MQNLFLLNFLQTPSTALDPSLKTIRVVKKNYNDPTRPVVIIVYSPNVFLI